MQPALESHMSAVGPDRLVFSDAPRLVYWELTRACDLACKHCRAEAIERRDPRELGTGEAKALLKEIQAFGDPPPQLVARVTLLVNHEHFEDPDSLGFPLEGGSSRADSPAVSFSE